MGFEIERKFLVSGNEWRQLATKQTTIRQSYLASNGKASIRVRINDNKSATLTVKSRPVDTRRLELEYDIPVLEAEALMQLRQGAVVEKVRHVVPQGDRAWEIDVFSGDNLGLVIAEMELRDEQQLIDLLPWIGEEVTGRAEYYNSYLVQNPFVTWPARERPARLEHSA